MSPKAHRTMPRWTAAEIATLRRIYPARSADEIAHKLKRSVKSVTSKATRLGLSKTATRLSEMGRENRWKDKRWSTRDARSR